MRLRKFVQPIADRTHFQHSYDHNHTFLPNPSSVHTNTLLPFVLILGNHSSGKSSFINHVLGRKVQTAGVAPTDDSFTIIVPGNEDMDKNGPALVGDPDLGFEGLKQFGPVLIAHTQLKVRSNTNISDFMIIDTPGMIDSPVFDEGTENNSRGYSIEGVCRWYAEKADVVLLFLDPDKPGTTAETLTVLTSALLGIEQKLFIILNKCDQFLKVTVTFSTCPMIARCSRRSCSVNTVAIIFL